ncbi:MAG TPA: hypothetical protein VGO11_07270 [Chthoniobacteraceae bacterium]|jgi:hypothetical protein|nr:hypothetical protein [Chthoniobacteraceae bacterium]
MKYLRLLAPLAAFACAWPARADVKLPAIFSEHMVLQRDVAAPVWGWADPGEEVTVEAAGAGLSVGEAKSTKTGADGKWMVRLGALKAGDSLTLTIKGRNTLTIRDVLVGEVWLCSGQSNMTMPVQWLSDFEHVKAAADFPQIRMFVEGSAPAAVPQQECKGTWRVCTPASVGGFSATAYFFGRDVHQALHLPVGLIHSSVQGTAIEAWTSLEAQKDKPELQPILERWDKMVTEWNSGKTQADYDQRLAAWKEASEKAKLEGKPELRAIYKPFDPNLHALRPANLFNGKIAPLIPYAIRGAIWYQGETGGGDFYGLQLETLIKDWRARWGEEFPFAWVQLPNFGKLQEQPVESGSAWLGVREGMLKTLALPKTGMAIAIDLGQAENLHPQNKQDVGKRLALWALAKVYDRKIASWSGPLPSGHQIEGGSVLISFAHADGGLIAKDGELKGFAIAGADRKWVKATAKIEGGRVIVSSPEVKEPAAVRYGWANNPDCNLYNGAGLPASPFRTDDWR